jgi:hypothetical protein
LVQCDSDNKVESEDSNEKKEAVCPRYSSISEYPEFSVCYITNYFLHDIMNLSSFKNYKLKVVNFRVVHIASDNQVFQKL